ncbi:hypothetical protein BPO_0260 [Bergeyella porcorum]|uniref:Uncharacterized protein n=1 Tax=Bergeyella porcorum TaxID=1735111 RepID=A0AAU0EZS6_9FLAO
MKKITIFAFLLSGFLGFSQRNLTIAEGKHPGATPLLEQKISWLLNGKTIKHLHI